MSVFTVAYLNLFIFLATAPGAAAVNLFGTRALSDKAREKLEHEIQWGPLGNVVSSAADTVTNIAESAVTNAAESVAGAMVPSMAKALLGDMAVDNFDLPPPSKSMVNQQVIVCIVAIVVAVSLGLLLDKFMPPPKSSTRPSYLCISTLLGSYALLIPGLISTLFQFLLGVEILGAKVIFTQEDDNYSAIVESTVGLVHLLFKTGGWIGAFLLILYSMVVPAVKIAALLVGEMWRENSDPRKVHVAKQLIEVVQMISKWACPDMFAYILLLYLFRHLNGAGGIVAAPAQLGIGFACFSIFCVCSTFSTLMVQVPVTAEEIDDGRRPWVLRTFGTESLFGVVAVAFILFMLVFALGMFTPTMAMFLDSGLLLKPTGPLPASLKPLVDSLHIEDLVNAEVTIAGATRALMAYIATGELNDIFAVLMLAIFVITLPIVNMLCLLLASWKMSDPEAAWRFIKVSRVLKHIEMLDVAIMGIIVVTCAGTAYHKQGVLFSVMMGLWVLLLAEILHYVLHYQVHGAYAHLSRAKA